MKDKLILSLLKQRNQYLFKLLVICILIIIFNLHEITYCAGIAPETLNNVECLVYPQETQTVGNGHYINHAPTADDKIKFFLGICSVILQVYYYYCMTVDFDISQEIPSISSNLDPN